MEYIDIASIIRRSDSKVLRKLPGFVISLLKKIIREKEMNRILEKYQDTEGGPLKTVLVSEWATLFFHLCPVRLGYYLTHHPPEP